MLFFLDYTKIYKVHIENDSKDKYAFAYTMDHIFREKPKLHKTNHVLYFVIEVIIIENILFIHRRTYYNVTIKGREMFNYLCTISYAQWKYKYSTCLTDVKNGAKCVILLFLSRYFYIHKCSSLVTIFYSYTELCHMLFFFHVYFEL